MSMIFTNRNQKKCAIVKCLYERSKRLVTKPSFISGDEKHLSPVLVSNGYPSSFVNKIKERHQSPALNPPPSSGPPQSSPASKASPNNFTTVYKNKAYASFLLLETTLRLHLVRSKDAVELAKQDGEVYRIPCECGKVFIAKLVDLCRRESRSRDI